MICASAALRRDNSRIRLTLRHLASLFSFLFLLFNGQSGLLCLLLGNLLLLHSQGILFAKVDIAQDEID